MAAQMRAARGDWLIIERAGIGQPPRKGQIVGVRSRDGSPPYVVRWAGYGHTSLLFPGPDARIISSRTVKRSNGLVARIWRRVTRGGSG